MPIKLLKSLDIAIDKNQNGCKELINEKKIFINLLIVDDNYFNILILEKYL